MTRRKRARVGDILEIRTSAGLAYFQYTHQHPEYGGLIRVLPGIYPQRPEALTELAQGPERFVVFFPVRAATNRGLVSIAAEASIPPHARAFPLFKAGRPGNWWL